MPVNFPFSCISSIGKCFSRLVIVLVFVFFDSIGVGSFMMSFICVFGFSMLARMSVSVTSPTTILFSSIGSCDIPWCVIVCAAFLMVSFGLSVMMFFCMMSFASFSSIFVSLVSVSSMRCT